MRSLDLEFKKRWIPWALDFMNRDLDSLTLIQKKKLLNELYFLTSPTFAKETLERFNEKTVSLSIRDEGINKYFGKEYEDEEVGMIPFIPPPRKVQKILKPFWKKLSNFLEKGDYEDNLPLPKLTTRFVYSVDLLTGKDITFIDYQLENASLENMIEFNLAKIFDGLEIDSIKKCDYERCRQKYFFNPTKRKKIYCSFLCASRSNAQRRREDLKKHPKEYQAYLEKQREYGRKRRRK